MIVLAKLALFAALIWFIVLLYRVECERKKERAWTTLHLGAKHQVGRSELASNVRAPLSSGGEYSPSWLAVIYERIRRKTRHLGIEVGP